jgi:CRP-like cAMP-binding protein
MTITPASLQQRFPNIKLDDHGIRELAVVLVSRDFSAGERLISCGQHSDTLYFIMSGAVQMSIRSNDATLHLGEKKAGMWVGDFGFISPGEATADVVAEEPTSVLILSHEAMTKLRERSPTTASALLQALSIELATRLRDSTHYVLEKEGEGAYDLRNTGNVGAPHAANERHGGWLSHVRKLLGLSGDRG